MNTIGHRRLVLASGSPYRARLLGEAGYDLVIDPPGVDERSADHLLAGSGPGGLALELARRKAAVVAQRHPGATVLAGDQVAVVDARSGLRQLHKQPDVDAAVEQLMAISGTTHRLHNGVYVLDVDTGTSVEGIDVQEVTMRRFERSEARRYVERFRPFDTAGCYRLEDGSEMGPLEPFVTTVVGEDPTGVLGVPIPMISRMLQRLDRMLQVM